MVKVQDSNPDREFHRYTFYYEMIKRIHMSSQVKRKQKLLLTLTLTVLITGSILAFSIQAAYSTEELFGAYNFLLSRSNTQTSIEQVQEELKGIQDDARIEGDETLAISIDNMVMQLGEAKKGLVEMGIFYSALEDKLQSLKQTAESTTTRSGETDSGRQITESTKESVRTTISGGVGEIEIEIESEDATIASNIGSSGEDGGSKEKTTVSPELHQPEDIKPIVPEWVRNNAGWYAEGLIPEGDFVRGLEWMINNGIIQIHVGEIEIEIEKEN